MSYETYTVDELLDANTAMNERADGLFDRLSRISTSVADRGIEVRVNLEGRLIGLELSVEAMGLPPDELAAEIFRLTHEASAAALSEGLAELKPVTGDELTEELSEIIAARPRPAEPVRKAETKAELDAPVPAPTPVPTPTPRALDDHDDFSAIESWALPR